MEGKNKMGVMPMPRLVANMSLPLMVSLLVQSLYNIVDSIFVARIGERALAAVSLAFPVQVLMIALSVGTSVGINSLLARSLGAGEDGVVSDVASSGVMLALAGMTLFAVPGIFFAGGLAALLTGDAVIRELCGQYLSVCMALCGGTFLETVYQRFLQSTGRAFDSMVSLVVGALINLILDPILIFGLLGAPSLGVRGAAIATVIGQWAGAGAAILLNSWRNPVVRPSLRGWRPRLHTLRRIYAVGLPTIVMQALGGVMLFSANAILISYSGTAVAFFGVFYRLQNFLLMPVNGLGQAAIPIAGFNYGAGNKRRVLELMKTILLAAAVLSAVMIAVFEAFPARMLGLFSAGPEMLALGVPALRIIAPTFLPASATIVLGYAASGLGNGVINMLGSALRQVVVLIPCLGFLAWRFDVGAAWIAFWPAEAAGILYAASAALRELKRKDILPAVGK